MSQSDKPTSKQLSYLKALASQTGTTFTYPKTKRQASAEIEKLRVRSANTNRSIERDNTRRENRAIVAHCRGAVGMATAIRDDEISGYGSTAAWA